jgi:head-tail adaptor
MLINGKPFNPGELKTPIVLAKKKLSKVTGGFQKIEYELIAETKAKWVNVHGQEAWLANAKGAIKAATITVRYRSDLDETCVIMIGMTVEEVIDEQDVLTGWTFTGGEVFEIISMDNIQQLNEYIEFKVKRVTAG